MAKFRQQSPPFQYSLSSPSLSRGPNPGSCFSSFSSRLQRFKELREGGREGRKDRREGGQRRIGKCRVEMHLRFFVREIRAEPPPPQQRRRRHKRAGHAATPATRRHWLRLVPRPEFGARECFRIQLEKWTKVRWPRPPRPARPPPTIRSH